LESIDSQIELGLFVLCGLFDPQRNGLRKARVFGTDPRALGMSWADLLSIVILLFPSGPGRLDDCYFENDLLDDRESLGNVI
jgi:hypothetical protein